MHSSHWRFFLFPAAILIATVLLAVSDWRGWFSRNPARDGEKALAAGNIVWAVRDFSTAQRQCDTDIAARFGLGAAYQGCGWDDEALKQYDETWTLASLNGARAMHSAGRIWFHRGELDRATACLQRALSLLPASPDIWYELGIVHREAGRHAAALAAFQEALRLEPDNAEYSQAVESLTGEESAPNGAFK